MFDILNNYLFIHRDEEDGGSGDTERKNEDARNVEELKQLHEDQKKKKISKDLSDAIASFGDFQRVDIAESEKLAAREEKDAQKVLKDLFEGMTVELKSTEDNTDAAQDNKCSIRITEDKDEMEFGFEGELSEEKKKSLESRGYRIAIEEIEQKSGAAGESKKYTVVVDLLEASKARSKDEIEKKMREVISDAGYEVEAISEENIGRFADNAAIVSGIRASDRELESEVSDLNKACESVGARSIVLQGYKDKFEQKAIALKGEAKGSSGFGKLMKFVQRQKLKNVIEQCEENMKDASKFKGIELLSTARALFKVMGHKVKTAIGMEKKTPKVSSSQETIEEISSVEEKSAVAPEEKKVNDKKPNQPVIPRPDSGTPKRNEMKKVTQTAQNKDKGFDLVKDNSGAEVKIKVEGNSIKTQPVKANAEHLKREALKSLEEGNKIIVTKDGSGHHILVKASEMSEEEIRATLKTILSEGLNLPHEKVNELTEQFINNVNAKKQAIKESASANVMASVADDISTSQIQQRVVQPNIMMQSQPVYSMQTAPFSYQMQQPIMMPQMQYQQTGAPFAMNMNMQQFPLDGISMLPSLMTQPQFHMTIPQYEITSCGGQPLQLQDLQNELQSIKVRIGELKEEQGRITQRQDELNDKLATLHVEHDKPIEDLNNNAKMEVELEDRQTNEKSDVIVAGKTMTVDWGKGGKPMPKIPFASGLHGVSFGGDAKAGQVDALKDERNAAGQELNNEKKDNQSGRSI